VGIVIALGPEGLVVAEGESAGQCGGWLFGEEARAKGRFTWNTRFQERVQLGDGAPLV